MKLDPGIFSLLRSSLWKDISTKLKFRHKKYLSSEMIPLWQLSSNKSTNQVVSKKLFSKAYSSDYCLKFSEIQVGWSMLLFFGP